MRKGHSLIIGKFDPPLAQHIECINKFLKDGPVCIGVNTGINTHLPIAVRMDLIEKLYWSKDVVVLRLPPLETTPLVSVIDCHRFEDMSLTVDDIQKEISEGQESWESKVPDKIKDELEALIT